MDPLLPAALSIKTGTYALLLGSGLSRAAGVPTGYEVVLDLIRLVARSEGADPEPDPAEWYRGRFGTEARYSDLLEVLAPAPADRGGLLRGYFEPSDEEREQGLKLPTTEHRAIAELVKRGWVRVIITTNLTGC